MIEAASGEEAEFVIGKTDRKTDLKIGVVLCDAALEGKINAFNLAQSIRSQKPAIAVVLAGVPAQASQAAARSAGPIPSALDT